MYEFQPRFPLDHALAFYRALSTGSNERGELLMLIGAITGEVGALLKANTVSLGVSTVDNATREELMAALAKLENTTQDEAAFDPSIWIPIILKLIELWLARKNK